MQPRAPKTVDGYMAQVPPNFRPMLQRLRRTIKAAAPDAEETISYQMPAYKKDGVLVYFAAFRDHCSLFVASDEVRRRYAAELKPFTAGKGTLRFTPEQPIPAGLVTRIVKMRVAENAARRAQRGRPARRRPAASRKAPGRARRRRGVRAQRRAAR